VHRGCRGLRRQRFERVTSPRRSRNKVNPDGSKGAAVNCASGTAGKGDQVTVQVDYSYRMVWPLGFGTQIPMTASMTLLVE
jgi:hypothetical protein